MIAGEIAGRADEAGLRLVRFLWCGNDGTIRTKASGRHGLEGRLERGIGVTVAMQAMNGLDQLQPVADMGPVGEYRLVPDLATFRVLPYAPRTGALLTDHMGLEGEPAPVCQRSSLKRMEARPAERGLVLRAAFENEFSLATVADGRYVPVDSGLCFSTISMTASQAYADALVAALEHQGIGLEQYYAELGHGQQEISTAHAPALRAADEQLLVRETHPQRSSTSTVRMRGDRRRIEVEDHLGGGGAGAPRPRACLSTRRADALQLCLAERHHDPPRRRDRGDVAKQRRLRAERHQVRHAASAVGQHHRQIAEHAPRIVRRAPLSRPGQRPPQRIGQPEPLRGQRQQRRARPRR
jgi:hypothetical protein